MHLPGARLALQGFVQLFSERNLKAEKEKWSEWAIDAQKEDLERKNPRFPTTFKHGRDLCMWDAPGILEKGTEWPEKLTGRHVRFQTWILCPDPLEICGHFKWEIQVRQIRTKIERQEEKINLCAFTMTGPEWKELKKNDADFEKVYAPILKDFPGFVPEE